MKWLVAIVIVVLLLVAGYHIRPDIDRAVEKHWHEEISFVTRTDDLTVSARRDSLLVLSLNFRRLDRWDLAMPAMQAADSLMPTEPLTKGLLGLFYLQTDRSVAAIEAWQQGALLEPDDPNLSYLATLDTAELQYVDTHMLEEMFVDSLINVRLEVPVYRAMDTEILAKTERKERIEGAIDQTFIVSGGVAILVLIWSLFKIRRARRRRAALRARDADGNEDAETGSVSKPMQYVVVVSSLLKIGQVCAALFNYFLLGTDISDFVSDYVFTPNNLFSLFTENLLFAGIFIVIVIVEVVRRTMIGAKTG